MSPVQSSTTFYRKGQNKTTNRTTTTATTSCNTEAEVVVMQFSRAARTAIKQHITTIEACLARGRGQAGHYTGRRIGGRASEP